MMHEDDQEAENPVTGRPVHVIALIGPAGAGKTTVATELQTSYRMTRFRFADTLKNMIELLGCTREHIDGSLKEKPLSLLCGATTRHAMQTLGTEWRDMLGPQGKYLWAIQTTEAIRKEADSAAGETEPLPVVVDDARFPHEIETLRAAGFKVRVVLVWDSRRRYPFFRMWLARRWWGRALMKLVPYMYLHESEAHWPVMREDDEIDNSGTVDDLRRKVHSLAKRQQQEHFFEIGAQSRVTLTKKKQPQQG
jgi:hypothetical protein